MSKKTKKKHKQKPSEMKQVSPYCFFKRTPIKEKSLKDTITQFHRKLNKDHYDIAFAIEWKTETPTAVNPCNDPGSSEDNGLDKRWLMINNRLVISPFTVKTAIANGFANLLGACYRVNNEDRYKEHAEEGIYPYIGRYKKYRVARNYSKAGLIVDVKEDGENKILVIQPVKEYLLDKDNTLNMHDEKYVSIEDRGHKPPIIKEISDNEFKGSIKLRYHGKYTHGLNNKNHKHHKHRFYQYDNGNINTLNFSINLQRLNKLQYIKDLKKDDFIYYEEFNGKIVGIGNNFLFKTSFFHEDTVPEEHTRCRDLEYACPRCRMFGFLFDDDGEEKGFKGRFKSSGLASDITIKETAPRKFYLTNTKINMKLKRWASETDEKDLVAEQILLPIQLEPKPNKRDVDGYYEKDTGNIKGAKVFKHGLLNSAENIQNANSMLQNEYNHELRSCAHVCRRGVSFNGTVAAENCTLEEIAALFLILQTSVSQHGFKVGTGKAFGMGSISSHITKMWFRSSKDYLWHSFDVNPDINRSQLSNQFKDNISELDKEISEILDATEFIKHINSIRDIENRKLSYPQVGQDYWSKFNRNQQ